MPLDGLECMNRGRKYRVGSVGRLSGPCITVGHDVGGGCHSGCERQYYTNESAASYKEMIARTSSAFIWSLLLLFWRAKSRQISVDSARRGSSRMMYEPQA